MTRHESTGGIIGAYGARGWRYAAFATIAGKRYATEIKKWLRTALFGSGDIPLFFGCASTFES